MDTVVATRTFTSEVDDMVTFCRSLEARKHFPGAVLQWEKPDTLYYGVGMRLKAAAMTDIEVEERLGEIRRQPGGVVAFDTVNRATWPDGHADASSEWLFTPGEDGTPHTLRFTYSYSAPSTKLVKTKELPAFKVAMEKVVNAYTSSLVKAAAG